MDTIRGRTMDIFIGALEHIAAQAPELALLAIIAWRLETKLGECIEDTQEMLDKLLTHVIETQKSQSRNSSQ